MKLEEHKGLTEVGLSDNAQLLLIVTTPFELYVQDMNGKKHAVEIPSVEPEVIRNYTVVYTMLFF